MKRNWKFSIWKKYHLDSEPRCCYICGEGVEPENLGAIGWLEARTVVCCDDVHDLNHFRTIMEAKNANWMMVIRLADQHEKQRLGRMKNEQAI